MSENLGRDIKYFHEKGQKKASGRCLQWTIAYGLIFLLFFGWIYYDANRCHVVWNSRVRGGLRSLGNTQWAFRGWNVNHHYGTFEDLKNAMYISDGYTPENMIENYDMTWDVSNVSTAVGEEIPYGVISTYTIIAMPDQFPERSTRCLHTFAITEDQVMRVYNPRNDNDLLSVKTWDPVL